MFDILDSNLDFKVPSRTNSMKKIHKKDNSPPSHNTSSPNPISKPSPSSNYDSHRFDSLDINMDMSKSRDVTGKGSHLHGPSGTGRTSMFKNISIEEDDKLGHFGRTEQTINPSRIGDSFVSMRNMKPPLRGRDSSNLNQPNRSDFGGIIIEEDPTLANSSHRYQESERQSRVSRRSSIDDRTGDIAKTLHREDLPFERVGIDHIKQEDSSGHKKADKQKNEIVRVDAGIIQEYQRQIEQLKSTFSRQIKFLEENLEKQVREGQEQRRKIMGEAERMQQEERGRMRRVFEEELKRTQQMGEWQRKRLEEAHQAELQCLRRSLQYSKNKSSERLANNQTVNSLEWSQKQREGAVEQQEKALSLREAELERRVIQFAGQRRRIEEQLREERKRLMTLQTTIKKESMQSRRALAEEKQRMVEEAGQMEIEILRRKDQLALDHKQIELNRVTLEKERQEICRTAHNITLREKQVLGREQGEQARANELELELMRKIKVVEMRAHELSIRKEVTRQTQQANSALQRPFSAGKNCQSTMTLLGRQREMQDWRPKENKKLDLGGYVQRVEKVGRVRHHKF